MIYVTRGKSKHVRGRVINTFRAGDAFAESNNGGEYYVQSIGKITAILNVGVYFSSGSDNYNYIKSTNLYLYSF